MKQIIQIPQGEVKFYGMAFVDAVSSPCRYKVFWGGRGGGKTTAAVRRQIIRTITEPYWRLIITRKKFNQIKDSIYASIEDEIKGAGLQDLFIFRKNPLEMECRLNGNKIMARGFDEPDKIKAIKDPTAVIYEECQQITEEDFDTTTSSLRTTKAEIEEYLLFNPVVKGDPEEHWLFKRWFLGYRGKSHDGKVEIETGVDIFNDRTGEFEPEVRSFEFTVVHSTYHDNIENLSSDYVALLESYKKTNRYRYESETLGIWSQPEVNNQFANYFDEDKHVSDRALFRPGYQIYISLDFNLDPFGFIFSHKWMDKDGLHCHQFDEAKIEHGDLEKGIEHIRQKYGNQSHLFVITGDRMGARRDFGRSDRASYYDRIKRAFALRPSQMDLQSNPTHIKSRSDLNYVLLHFPDYIVHPKCLETIRDLNVVEIDAFGKIVKSDRKNVEQRADFLDCKRYEVNDRFFRKWIKSHQKMPTK